MTTTHHTPIAVGASNHPDTVNDPLGQLDAAIGASNAAINAANTARATADNVLDGRIDTLILTSGDSSPEVADARAAMPTNDVSAVLRDAVAWAGGDVFNVKAYGATGDGVTDDTAAIQAAIDAAEAAGSGRVLLPAGDYLVSAMLTLTGNDIEIVGLKASITQETDYTSILLITGRHNRVAGLTFNQTQTGDQGPTNSATWEAYGAGVVIKQCNDNVVEYCTLNDCGARSAGNSPRGYNNSGAGVYVSGGINNTVQHCRFYACIMGINEDDWTNTAAPLFYVKNNKYLYNQFDATWRPILVDYGAAYNGKYFEPPLIHGNRMINPPATVGTLDSRGILMSVFNCEYGFRITDNIIEGAWTYGIALFLGGRRGVISGNVIIGAERGMAFNSSSYVMRDCTIANNSIFNCQLGIRLYGLQNCVFTGNIIRNTTVAAGISVSDYCHNLQFVGNNITYCATHGMSISQSWSVTIADNIIAHNSQAAIGVSSGIYIAGDAWANGIVITGNQFDETTDNTTAVTQLYAIQAASGFFAAAAYKKPGIVAGNHFGRTGGLSEPSPDTASGFQVRNNISSVTPFVPRYYAESLTGSKTNIANNSATAVADLVLGGSGLLMAAYMVSAIVTSAVTSSTQVWLVGQGFSTGTAVKLSEALYGHSSITLTAAANTAGRKVTLTITQINGSAQACTVTLAIIPLIASGSPVITLTML